jgi:hypothetical protein
MKFFTAVRRLVANALTPRSSERTQSLSTTSIWML